MFAVINVSALQGTGEAMEMRRGGGVVGGGQHDCVKKGQCLIAYSLPFFFQRFLECRTATSSQLQIVLTLNFNVATPLSMNRGD